VFIETGKLTVKFDYRLDGSFIQSSIISINYRLIESRFASLLWTDWLEIDIMKLALISATEWRWQTCILAILSCCLW